MFAENLREKSKELRSLPLAAGSLALRGWGSTATLRSPQIGSGSVLVCLGSGASGVPAVRTPCTGGSHVSPPCLVPSWFFCYHGDEWGSSEGGRRVLGSGAK